MVTADPAWKPLFKWQIRYATVMGVLALLMGLVYREFARPFFGGLGLEEQWRYGHFMSLVHGHTFLLGVVIPAVLALLTMLVLAQLTEKDRQAMTLRFKVYVAASAVALLLMVYKGLAFIVGAGQPLDALDAALFGGSRWLRGILFGGSHIALFWAVGEYTARFFRATR